MGRTHSMLHYSVIVRPGETAKNLILNLTIARMSMVPRKTNPGWLTGGRLMRREYLINEYAKECTHSGFHAIWFFQDFSRTFATFSLTRFRYFISGSNMVNILLKVHEIFAKIKKSYLPSLATSILWKYGFKQWADNGEIKKLPNSLCGPHKPL